MKEVKWLMVQKCQKYPIAISDWYLERSKMMYLNHIRTTSYIDLHRKKVTEKSVRQL